MAKDAITTREQETAGLVVVVAERAPLLVLELSGRVILVELVVLHPRTLAAVEEAPGVSAATQRQRTAGMAGRALRPFQAPASTSGVAVVDGDTQHLALEWVASAEAETALHLQP